LDIEVEVEDQVILDNLFIQSKCIKTKIGDNILEY